MIGVLCSSEEFLVVLYILEEEWIFGIIECGMLNVLRMLLCYLSVLRFMNIVCEVLVMLVMCILLLMLLVRFYRI